MMKILLLAQSMNPERYQQNTTIQHTQRRTWNPLSWQELNLSIIPGTARVMCCIYVLLTIICELGVEWTIENTGDVVTCVDE